MLRFLFDGWARWQSSRRKVFFYRAGTKSRRVDPLLVVQQLNRVEPNWESLLGTIGSKVPDVLGAEMRAKAEKDRNDAAARLVEVSRTVFDMPPLGHDGSGCTQEEVIGTITGFVLFMGRLAEAARPFYPASVPASIPGIG